MWMQDLFPSFPALSIRRPFCKNCSPDFSDKNSNSRSLASRGKASQAGDFLSKAPLATSLSTSSSTFRFWQFLERQGVPKHRVFVVLWRAGCWKQTLQQKKSVCTFSFSICIYIYVHTFIYIYISFTIHYIHILSGSFPSPATFYGNCPHNLIGSFLFAETPQYQLFSSKKSREKTFFIFFSEILGIHASIINNKTLLTSIKHIQNLNSSSSSNEIFQ